MSFQEIQLSRDIEAGATHRFRYATDVVRTDGGYEVRNERWSAPLSRWDFSVEPGDESYDDTLTEFINLFHIVGGAAGGFLFRSWRNNDWRAVDEVIGTGDGTTTRFGLVRNYTIGAVTRQRRITRPEADTIVVRVDGLEVAHTYVEGGYVDITAPSASAVVAADFDYFYPVRFSDDELELLAHSGELEQPVDISLFEIRENV